MRVWLGRLSQVQLSVWLVLAVVIVTSAWITWRFLAGPYLAGGKPSIFQVFGWLFWMSAFAVVIVWLCWVRTETGWRWRWNNV